MLLTLNSKEQIKYSVKERNIFSRAFVLSECREIQKHPESDVFRKYIGSRNHPFRNETKNTPFGKNILKGEIEKISHWFPPVTCTD